MNKKARRVITTQRTIVFRLDIVKISGLSCKLLYAVAYVPPLAHTRVRGGSLSLSLGGALGITRVDAYAPVGFGLRRIFPSKAFAFFGTSTKVATVRPAHNRAVCQ